MNDQIDQLSKYEKAKIDIMQAKHSFEQLTPQNQERLMRDVCGNAALEKIIQLLLGC